MPNSSFVVISCSNCNRTVRTAAARAKLGLCEDCERSGNLNLPEPESQSLQMEPIFESERRSAAVLSLICFIAGILSVIAMLMGVLSAIAPGGGSPIVWGSIGGAGFLMASIGWLLASLLRVTIAVANAAQQTR